MDRLESALRVVLQWVEAYNRHDEATLTTLVCEDCVLEHHAPAPAGTVHSGRADVSAFWRRTFEATPGARCEVEELTSLGTRCLLRWKDEAGRRGLDVVRVRDGQIAQILSYTKG